MAEKMSTPLCNKLMDTGSFKSIFSGTTAELRIYSGAVPATADAAITGVKIATVKEAAAALNFLASAAGGVLAKSATAWTDPSAVGGVATHWRLCLAADTDGADSTTYPRIQGTVGTVGADMNLSTTTIGAASTFTMNYFTQALVPS